MVEEGVDILGYFMRGLRNGRLKNPCNPGRSCGDVYVERVLLDVETVLVVVKTVLADVKTARAYGRTIHVDAKRKNGVRARTAPDVSTASCGADWTRSWPPV
ncbi:hypothetical protein VSDG_09314 [Cytospora chrysosperma]|uniref:Uncharacterized protein n=1 Tax=Cytospora chrysosperma TaxID=252740 RepID=A0A423VCA1_CYTCH|nr:hypothetical protein VSDG_09314 [Valsa sordida]